MSNAILLLKHEHLTFARMLEVLESELDRLERDDGADLEIIERVAEYLGGYPQECHHPKEDVVYRRLCQRIPDGAGAISKLVADHERLAAVVSAFAAAAADATASRERGVEALVTTGRTALCAYRNHMAAEEHEFFPAALRCFTAADWDAIDFTLFDSEDCVFDRHAEDRFARLRERIDAVIGARDESRSRLAEARWLYRLQGVDDFNAAMSDRGIRLERDGADYLLLERGEPGVGIPESDESRAVWCAYYFLKGRHGDGMSPVDFHARAAE